MLLQILVVQVLHTDVQNEDGGESEEEVLLLRPHQPEADQGAAKFAAGNRRQRGRHHR